MVTLIPSSKITRLQARLTKYEAQLEVADDTYLELLSRNNAEYRMNTSEGEQRARIQDLAKLKTQIVTLTSEIETIYNQLSGSGLVSMRLRRNRATFLG